MTLVPASRSAVSVETEASAPPTACSRMLKTSQEMKRIVYQAGRRRLKLVPKVMQMCLRAKRGC